MCVSLTLHGEALQGGGSVAKDIKYADKAVFFPWRPRLRALHLRPVCIVCGLVQTAKPP